MPHYTIAVIHQERDVQVFPKRREDDTSFEECCKRIGMMVMAENIDRITVYRDGETYRTVIRKLSTDQIEELCRQAYTRISKAYGHRDAHLSELPKRIQGLVYSICESVVRKVLFGDIPPVSESHESEV